MKTDKFTTKLDEIRQMDDKSLQNFIKEMEAKLFTQRYEVRSGQEKASHLITAYKKAIAQGKTEMRARQNQENTNKN